MDSQSNQDTERWKYKYYEALGQLETREKAWKHAELVLRQCASRLTTLADAPDPALRQALDRLGEGLRDGLDGDELERLIDELTRGISARDRQRRRSKPLAPNAVLLLLLDSIEFPGEYAGVAGDLRKRIVPQREGDGFDAFRREFATLISDALREQPQPHGPPAPASGAADHERLGLLDRLFGRRAPHRGGVASGHAAETPDAEEALYEATAAARSVLRRVLERGGPVEHGDALLRRITEVRAEELLDLADRIALAVTRRVDAIEVPTELGEPTVQEVLLKLLERLDIPENLLERAHAIRRRLLAAGEERDLDRDLADIADLIAEMRSRAEGEKEDIENFLQTLTLRLKEIDSGFRENAASQRESLENGRRLDADVTAHHVEGIEQTVSDATALEALKGAVRERVDAIRSRMEAFRVAEEERTREAEARVEELSARLASMDQESSGLRERIRAERRRALIDPLTGISNRLAYNERLEQEYARWRRYRTPLVLVVWDIDRFKAINDTYGHQAGDKVLRVVAKLLRSRLRETDFVARYGGEEFVCLMPETTPEAALNVCDTLRRGIERAEFQHRGSRVSITISCGLAEFREGDEPEEVFSRADGALYRAKAAGRNRCVTEDY